MIFSGGGALYPVGHYSVPHSASGSELSVAEWRTFRTEIAIPRRVAIFRYRALIPWTTQIKNGNLKFSGPPQNLGR